MIVEAAKSEDGVSNQYIPDKIVFESTNSLVKKAEDILTSDSFSFQIGKVVTTSVMFLETQQIVSSWSENGYIAVDGETATTLAVAQRFEAEAVSLLTCSDNLALGDNFYEAHEDRELAEESAFERIQNLALQLS